VADGQATKIFLPTELGGALSSLGAVAEIFRNQSGPATPAPVPVQPTPKVPVPVRPVPNLES
ncbi:MAG: hypothetical protein Q8O00_16175, partial [Holophaga sp.]|nr:hypothetical protein [Holophaga sp.]